MEMKRDCLVSEEDSDQRFLHCRERFTFSLSCGFNYQSLTCAWWLPVSAGVVWQHKMLLAVSDHSTHILVPHVCTNRLQGPYWNFMSHLVYVDTPSVARRCFSFLICPQEQPITKFNSFKATAEFFGGDVVLQGHIFLWPLWLELVGCVFITKQTADGQMNHSLEKLNYFSLYTISGILFFNYNYATKRWELNDSDSSSGSFIVPLMTPLRIL